MLALFATFVLVPLLYIPGYLLLLAWLGLAQSEDVLERHFQRVLLGALVNGWLAFTLAQVGIFSATLHLGLLAVICILALIIAWWRGGVQWPQMPLGVVVGRQSAQELDWFVWLRTVGWPLIGFATIGLLFGLLVARPFEVVLGVRDAGVYATTGFAIAQTGGIVQYDEVLAGIATDQQASDPSVRAAAQAETNFLAAPDANRNIATRLRAAGFYIHEGDLEQGRVVPQGFHLFPVWIGLLTSLLGREGGLLATGLMGLLGLWSVGMLGRRLAGNAVALIGMLLLALNGVQVWFSRYSTTETTAQFLTFAGLYGFALLQSPPSATMTARQHLVGALFAGLAFGQLAFTRIDFFIVVLPVLGYLLYLWLTRRWSRPHTLLFFSLGITLLHAVWYIITVARAYFFDTLYARLQDFAITALVSLPFLTPALRGIYLSDEDSKIGIRLNDAGDWRWNIPGIAVELLIVLAVIVGLWALRRWGQPLLKWFEAKLHRWGKLVLHASAAALVVLAAYGYLVRPQVLSAETLSALPGCLAPTQLRQPTGSCLQLQGYIGAPVAPATHPNPVEYALDTLPERLRGQPVPPRLSDDTRLRDTVGIAQANMVRIGWYLSPLGMVLGVVGSALWWRRMDRASWLFLALALIMAIVFIRQTYGAGNQTYIYILRRYVPLVYPAFCLAIGYALVALAKHRPQTTERGSSFVLRLASCALALTLVAFLALTNRTIYRHVEYGGALAQIDQIAQEFGPQDVLLLRGGDHNYDAARDIPDLLTTPLRYIHGLNAFTIKSRWPGNYADELARYVQHWQAQGRTVYFVLGPSGAVGLPGIALEPVRHIGLQLQEFEQLTDQKPSNIALFSLDFAVYRVTATTPPPVTAVAVDEYAAQVRGFYRPEQVNGQTFTWTNGDALLRLPWLRSDQPVTVTLQLAGGQRLPTGPVQATVSFAPETTFWSEAAEKTLQFSTPHQFQLTEAMESYTLTIDPRQFPAPANGTLLLRIESDTWVPAQSALQLPSNDGRNLGVQFGGLTISQD